MGSKSTCPKKIATEKQVKPKNQLAPYRTWDRNTSAPPIPTKKQKSTIRLLLNNKKILKNDYLKSKVLPIF